MDERPEEVSAGGVVVRSGAAGPEVLIAEQRDWNTGDLNVRLPKGHLEDGETLDEAARREVAEEVGIEARVLHALTPHRYAFWHEAKKVRIPKVVHFFLMQHESGEARPHDGEMERVFWVSFDEAEARLTFENERTVVGEARRLLASESPPGT